MTGIRKRGGDKRFTYLPSQDDETDIEKGKKMIFSKLLCILYNNDHALFFNLRGKVMFFLVREELTRTHHFFLNYSAESN